MSDASGRTLTRFRFDRPELAGAVADVGVLVPIAVALIVTNGLSPTAVLLPAGALYVVTAFRYRLPVAVQPLKAFGAIAIALGLGADEIAAGALVLGGVFVALGLTGVLDAVARVFPRPVIRGVQLAVGLLFLKVAYGLVTEPPSAFRDAGAPSWWLVGGALAVLVLSWLLRRHAVSLALVGGALAVMVVTGWDELALGPAPVHWPSLSLEAFAVATTALVVPQLPLTFANSCLAPADAARAYYGEREASLVRPSRLALSLGTANLLAGAVSGMPVCHGAGGMTAHRSFGARTGGAPLVMGAALLGLALVLGAGLSGLLTGFPLPVLAGLLAAAGVLHLMLLRDLARPADWAVALTVGVPGLFGQLALGLLAGLVAAWLVHLAERRGVRTG